VDPAVARDQNGRVHQRDGHAAGIVGFLRSGFRARRG
jgi:hypothetical protein